ncbi:MAG: FAD-binding oxidoreductase [Solirubrobacteraceae bacterium]
MGYEQLSRREFIERGVLATLAASALAGCAAAPRARPATATQPTPARPPAGPPSAAAWSALAASLSGQLVLPSDSDYPTARLVYDMRFEDATPAAIAFCASATDVQRVIDFARIHEIRPIPRCGGHSYAGYSTGSGLIVDVTPMSAVTVSAAAGAPTATVGAGTRLIDLYAATASAGVLVPGGSCPTVGISGLALGGGIGVLGRRYGLTCDAIEALTAVAADSRLLSVSASSEPDLYWACRGGGGGNFAIVTSFELAAHPIPPLALFDIEFPWGAAGDLLGAWQAWIENAPDELWSNCLLLSAGGSGLLARSAGVYAGELSTLSSLIDRLIAAVGTQPVSQFAAANSYLTAMLIEAGCADRTLAQCHLAGGAGAGTLPRSAFVAKSAYVASAFSSPAIAAAVDAVSSFQRELPTVGGGLSFDSYGGAINRVAADATAFVHRDALCQIQLSGSLAAPIDPASLRDVQSWLGQTATALAPYCDGQAYQNYIDPTLADWQQAYYGANLERLVAVKRRYDPDDVFHFAQSIPTGL